MGKFPNFSQEDFDAGRPKPCFSAISANWHGFCKGREEAAAQADGTFEGQSSGSKTMQEKSNPVREIGQLLSVAIAAVLFGSTLILSAVGPARASEAPMLATQDTPAALRYLA
jgi:hypothetical protein